MQIVKQLGSSRSVRGFTIVELLVVIGVLSIVVSLLLPSLSGERGRGYAAKSLSNIRQLNVALSLYADANKDLPPVFAPPSWPPAMPFQFDFGTVGSGYWFEHSWAASIALCQTLGNSSVAHAPGNPNVAPDSVHQGERVYFGDYLLTNTLYATPSFFNWNTQTGLAQFGAQRLSSVAFPSSKGLMTQVVLYHYPQYGPTLACCAADVAAPVAFADGSGSEHILKRMRPGITNLFARIHLLPSVDPRAIPGGPVIDTVDGTQGRDR